MKILTAILLLGAVALVGAWLWWPRNNPDVALESPSPTPYLYDYYTETPTPYITSQATPSIAPTPLGQGGAGPAPVRRPVFITLDSLNGSGEYGVAAIIANKNDLAEVAFNVVLAPVGVYQQAYIMSGTCANLKDIVFALAPLINGSSTTTLNADFLDVVRAEGQLAVVVYSPLAESPIPYACGQLH